jgi:hypothetical protein
MPVRLSRGNSAKRRWRHAEWQRMTHMIMNPLGRLRFQCAASVFDLSSNLLHKCLIISFQLNDLPRQSRAKLLPPPTAKMTSWLWPLYVHDSPHLWQTDTICETISMVATQIYVPRRGPNRPQCHDCDDDGAPPLHSGYSRRPACSVRHRPETSMCVSRPSQPRPCTAGRA